MGPLFVVPGPVPCGGEAAGAWFNSRTKHEQRKGSPCRSTTTVGSPSAAAAGPARVLAPDVPRASGRARTGRTSLGPAAAVIPIAAARTAVRTAAEVSAAAAVKANRAVAQQVPAAARERTEAASSAERTARTAIIVGDPTVVTTGGEVATARTGRTATAEVATIVVVRPIAHTATGAAISIGVAVGPAVTVAATPVARAAVASIDLRATVVTAVDAVGSVVPGRNVMTPGVADSGAGATAEQMPVGAETSGVRQPIESSATGTSTAPTAGPARSVGAAVKARMPRAVAEPIGATRGRRSRRCPTTSRPVNSIRRSAAIC